MYKRINLFLIILLILSIHVFSQKLSISVFYENSPQSATITVLKGNYTIIGDSISTFSLNTENVVYLTRTGDSIMIRDLSHSLGIFHKVYFKAGSDSCYLRIKPVFPAFEPRNYDDDLEVTIGFERLQMICRVALEKYIAGVVQAESGPKATLEYYKSQAIICRTYYYSHFNRHVGEGFQLCDGVHCQVYKGRCDQNPIITKGAGLTSGLVILTPDSVLITAAFHSNCGGETENSENVWLISKPYLRSVTDSYCQNQHNSRWELKISLDDWIKYLKIYGFKEAVKSSLSYSFNQAHRKVYYKVGNDSIPFRKLREDYKLRSSFFSVVVENDKIVLKGKGYGHGIGLCQEGAMQMSKLGQSFEDIIHFYYQNVKIVNYADLNK